jgi:hypothetical protein
VSEENRVDVVTAQDIIISRAFDCTHALVAALQPLAPYERTRALWMAMTALGDIPPDATTFTIKQASFRL